MCSNAEGDRKTYHFPAFHSKSLITDLSMSTFPTEFLSSFETKSGGIWPCCRIYCSVDERAGRFIDSRQSQSWMPFSLTGISASVL